VRAPPAILGLLAVSPAGCEGGELPRETAAGSPGPSVAELRLAPRMPAGARAWASTRHRLRVSVPPGWHVGREQLLPRMAPPGAILALGTFVPRREPGVACSRAPDLPQLGVGRREALVLVEEDARGHAWLALARPERFRLMRQLERVSDRVGGGRRVFPWNCLNHPGVAGLWTVFGASGRLLSVTAIVGRDAPRRVLRETLGVLESLRFERREHSISVVPADGRPSTGFVVRLVTGTSTGTRGRRRKVYVARVSGPPRSACVIEHETYFPPAPRGTRVAASLRPQRTHGGRWCRGRFRGLITLRYGFACPRRGPCRVPANFPRHTERVGRFTFVVR
jgi:hypothetical protein